MKRPAFFLTAFFVLFLALIGFSTPAQAARSQQTVPQPTATMTPYVPPAATPTPSATYVSPIPTPGQTRCEINSKVPMQFEDDLLVSISAKGAPGPGWRVVETVSQTVIKTGAIDGQGGIRTDVRLRYNTSYKLEVETQNGWYTSRSCELRFEKPIGPKPVISIESRIVTVGEKFEICVVTTDITGYEILSFQGYVQYPQNLELLSYSVGDVPSGDIDWGLGDPNQLAFVKYQLDFMEGDGSLFCIKFRAVSVGENGWYIRFRYNDWPSSWMEIQTGTMTVLPAPELIYIPTIFR